MLTETGSNVDDPEGFTTAYFHRPEQHAAERAGAELSDVTASGVSVVVVVVAQDERELVRTQQVLRRHLPLPPPRSLMSGLVTRLNYRRQWVQV